MECLLRKPNCESGSTFFSSEIFISLFNNIFSNTFDNIGSKLIGLYDDGQSGGFFGLKISMTVEYFHVIGKYVSLSIELNNKSEV